MGSILCGQRRSIDHWNVHSPLKRRVLRTERDGAALDSYIHTDVDSIVEGSHRVNERSLVLGVLVLVLGSLVLVPLAGADHGPYCRSGDLACCSQYEIHTGVNYALCAVCVMSGDFWETHGNHCHHT